MTGIPPRKAAGFILFHMEGESVMWLALRNSTHGTWGFPKGHVWENETTRDAARRELQEETGIAEVRVLDGFEREISYDAKYPDGQKFPKRVTYLLAESPDDSVSLSAEHSEYRWVSAREMIELLQFENLRNVFSQAVEFKKNFPNGGI